MLDLARHTVDQKSGRLEPEVFHDQYETGLVSLINQRAPANGRARYGDFGSVVYAPTVSTF
jgi:non-homologous end joining protein Ku